MCLTILFICNLNSVLYLENVVETVKIKSWKLAKCPNNEGWTDVSEVEDQLNSVQVLIYRKKFKNWVMKYPQK